MSFLDNFYYICYRELAKTKAMRYTVKHFPIATTSKRGLAVGDFLCPTIVHPDNRIEKVTFKNGVKALVVNGLLPEQDYDFDEEWQVMKHGILTNPPEGYDLVAQGNKVLGKTLIVFIR